MNIHFLISELHKLHERVEEATAEEKKKKYQCAPSQLKQAIGQKNRMFSSNEQNDAQELLRCLLDGLSAELNRVTEKPKYEELDFDELPLHEQAKRWWQYSLKREDSVITDIFQGQLLSRTTCTQCNHRSCAFDSFMDLQVPIQQAAEKAVLNLAYCLKTFVAKEKLKMPCSHCKHEVLKVRDMTVWRLPKVLVVHLKRFEANGYYKRKIETKIRIPHLLQMKDFAPYSGKFFLQ